MKERLKTIFLLILVILALFLATKIWIQIPHPEIIFEPKSTEEEISPQLKELIVPKKMLLNFGGSNHTVLYNTQSLWSNYTTVLESTFDPENVDLLKWEKIDHEDYLKLHQERSIVFYINGDIYSVLLREIFGIDELKDMELKINELYFSADGKYLILGSQDKYYKTYLEDSNIQNSEQYLNNFMNEEVYTRYKSLWELYNIDSLAYVPVEPLLAPKAKIYENDIQRLTAPYEEDLAQRFLGQNIEAYHIIEEENSSLYVLNQKSFRVDDQGVLEYWDNGDPQGTPQTPLTTLNVALDFVIQKTGLGEMLYIDKIMPIYSNGKAGYEVDFNLVETIYDVVPYKNDGKGYINLKVFDNQVRSFKYVYRSFSAESSEFEDQYLMDFLEIIENKIDFLSTYTGKEDLKPKDFLMDIEDISLCYIDDVSEDKSLLIPAYCIKWQSRLLYFDGMTGAFIMEKGY